MHTTTDSGQSRDTHEIPASCNTLNPHATVDMQVQAKLGTLRRFPHENNATKKLHKKTQSALELRVGSETCWNLHLSVALFLEVLPLNVVHEALGFLFKTSTQAPENGDMIFELIRP